MFVEPGEAGTSDPAFNFVFHDNIFLLLPKSCPRNTTEIHGINKIERIN